MEKIPALLILANDLQRAGEFAASRKCYQQYLEEYPGTCLCYKALFEVADNYFYEKEKEKARKAYGDFLAYCKEQPPATEEETGWVKAYTALTKSRLKTLNGT